MRVSLEQLQHVCNEIKNKNEIAIIEKYGRIGKHQTRIITSKIIYICLHFNELLITVKNLKSLNFT